MMSDFRSLLSSFQVATGAKPSREDIRAKGSEEAGLPKKIESLWRNCQIQSATRKVHQQHRERLAKKRQITKSNLGEESTQSRDHVNAKEEKPIHIAICATIVSSLSQEAIWRSWLSHSSANCTASFHVHAKTPSAISNDSWLKSKLIPISHNPNWNDIRVVQAMLSLAKYALEGTEGTRITHIMYVTESCIPLTTMGELANMIRRKEADLGLESNTGLSFVDAFGRDSPRCTRFDEHRCFNVNDIPNEAIYKALPGWSLMSANHMRQIINIPNDYLGGEDLFPLFKNVWAPEEVFFPTALALLGKLPGGDEVVNQSIMWSKWDDRAKGKDRAHPIVYDGEFSKKLVQDARMEGCYFMRKWKRRLDAREWERICITQSVSVPSAATGSLKRHRDDGYIDQKCGGPDTKQIKT